MTVVGPCPTTVLIGTSAVGGAGLLDYVRRRVVWSALFAYFGWQHFKKDKIPDFPMEHGPNRAECALWDSDDGEKLTDQDVWRVLSLVLQRVDPDAFVHVFTSFLNFRFGSHASRRRWAGDRSQNDTVVHGFYRKMGEILVTNHTVEGIMSGEADRSAVFAIIVFVAVLYVALRYLGYLQWNDASQSHIDNNQCRCTCRKTVVRDTSDDQLDLEPSGERDRCKIALDLFLSPVSRLGKGAFSKEVAPNLARESPATVTRSLSFSSPAAVSDKVSTRLEVQRSLRDSRHGRRVRRDR